ncbi:hypothetical protein EZS27_012284 [termite gut metagenome]|uniref:Uncharacterized protein n=1 Tax=termite gut metagenome TaxID=433724 RepID=A0A5J4S0W8_9ZZZZ
MRRIISILLIFVVLMAGAHPVFAIHFCGGKLYSVGLMTNESVRPCCGENAATDTSYSGHTESLLFTESHTSCCHIQKVQISTDDYQRQAQLNTPPVLPAFDSAWIILNYISNWIEPDKSLIIQHLFPPGGLSRQNIDVLASICIYRI